MKYCAIAALLGATQGVELTNQQKLFAEMNKVVETVQDWEGYHASHHEFPGTVNEYGNFMDAYTRTLPVRFQGDSADTGAYPVDKFTQNMISKYAIEGIQGKKEKDPSPTGAFYLTKETARNASVEVICTHFALCGSKGEDYLKTHYEEAWNYYDVNREGKIDAVGVSQFFRFLTRPLGMIDLQ